MRVNLDALYVAFTKNDLDFILKNLLDVIAELKGARRVVDKAEQFCEFTSDPGFDADFGAEALEDFKDAVERHKRGK